MMKYLFKILLVTSVIGGVLCSGNVWATTATGFATSGAGTNWTTPTNIYSNNAAYAWYTAATQDYLQATTNVFSAIPAGSTINGVTVTVRGYNTDATAINRQYKIALTKDGATPVGTWKTAVQFSTGLADNITGTTVDLWGTTLTPADVQASTFGALITDNDTTVGGNFRIDSVNFSVDYTLPSIYGTTTANSVVHLLQNGVDRGTTTADAAGQYYFTNSIVSGDAVLAYTDGMADKINEIAVAASTTLNMGNRLTHAYDGMVVIGTTSVTNAKIVQSLGAFSAADVFVSGAGTSVTVGGGKTFYTTTSFAPGGVLDVPALTIGGGTFNGGSATITIGGDLTTTSGAFTSTSGTLYLKGNLSGSFTANNGTVILNGVNQTISGAWTFYKLTKIVAAADTLTFTAGTTTTISNNLTLQGSAGQLLSLRSSTPGVYWNISVPAAKTISWIDVQDSYASGAGIPVNASNLSDSGHNVQWVSNISGTTIANATVHLVLNGVDKGTTVADAAGLYSFSVPVVSGDAAILYLDGNASKNNVIAVVSGTTLPLSNQLASNSNAVQIITNGVTNAKIVQAIGAFSAPDVFVSGSGTSVTTTKTLLAFSYFLPGGDLDVPGLDIRNSFNGGSGTITIRGNLDINGGSFTSTSGTLFVAGALHLGFGLTFLHNNGTVNFNGTNQSIEPVTFGWESWEFYNFTKNAVAADTLTFPTTFQVTILNNLTLQGSAGQLLSLRSSTPGKYWTILVPASKNISYVDVKDSYASNSGAGVCIPVNASNFTDSGHNVQWISSISGKAVANAKVHLVLNGIDKGTTIADAAGIYAFSAPVVPGDTAILYLDGNASKINVIAVVSDITLTLSDLLTNTYNNDIVIGTDGITNAKIVQAIGAFSAADVFVSGSGTSVTVGGGKTFYILNSFTPGGVLNVSALTIENYATFTGGADNCTVTGDFNIDFSGIFIAPSGTMTIGGNLVRPGSPTGTFIHNSGTVVFNGTNQSIQQVSNPDLKFYNFSKNVISADTLTISPGMILAFDGAVNINGMPGQLLTLTGTPGWGFKLNATATKNMSYLVVKNSGASSSNAALLPVNPLYSVDGAGNNGWWVKISGNVYTDEGITNIGMGKTVRFVLSGVSHGTAVTTAGGAYTYTFLNPVYTAGDSLLAHIDGDATYHANTFGYFFTGGVLAAVNLYNGYVIANGSFTPSTNLYADTASGHGAYLPANPADLMYSCSGSNIIVSTGTLYVPAGQIYTPGGNIDSAPTMKILGTFNGATFSHTIAGPLTSIGTLNMTSSFVNVGGDFASSGIFSGGTTATTVAGNLSITGGTFTPGSGNLSIGGNLTMSAGSFTAGTGTVTLTGANQTINGAFTFKNLTKIRALADTLTFAAGKTITITGMATLQGAPEQFLSLVSSTPGVRWLFIMSNTGVKNMSYLAVKDSTAAGSPVAMKPIAPGNSVSLGNSLAWFTGYLIDSLIKKSTDSTYTGAGTVETGIPIIQVVSNSALSNNSLAYNVQFQNGSEMTDNLVITGTATGSGFLIQYLDETATDRTAAVTGAGYTIVNLVSGDTRVWTVNVTMAATVKGGTSYPVIIKATSAGDGTKIDRVKASTSSSSANPMLIMSASKVTPKPGEDNILTTIMANPAGLSAASGNIPWIPVPTYNDLKVGSTTFTADTSTLAAAYQYSNDNKVTWAYAPVSGGCSAPVGYDRCVTHVRWTTTGSMPSGTSCTLGMTVRQR